jgi:hypothetical protein
MEILTGVLTLIALAILFHLVIEHTWFVLGACVVAYVIYAYHAGPLVGGVVVALPSIIQAVMTVAIWPIMLIGLFLIVKDLSPSKEK